MANLSDGIKQGSVWRGGLPEKATLSLRIGSYDLYRETKMARTRCGVRSQRERFFLVSILSGDCGTVYHPIIKNDDDETTWDYTKWRQS